VRLTAAALIAASLLAQNPVVEGNSASPVRVIAYEDLQCPDCAVYRKMLDEHLLPKYGDRVAFEHRDFPLPKHNWARRAAIAARYLERQDPALGVAFRRWAFTNQREITAENLTDKLSDWAKANRVDPNKLTTALEDPTLAKLVEDDYQDGIARGVARTPTVLVNGESFIETFTVEEISKGIDAALKAVSK
jgi:protein-disulfide isomerase